MRAALIIYRVASFQVAATAAVAILSLSVCCRSDYIAYYFGINIVFFSTFVLIILCYCHELFVSKIPIMAQEHSVDSYWTFRRDIRK